MDFGCVRFPSPRQDRSSRERNLRGVLGLSLQAKVCVPFEIDARNNTYTVLLIKRKASGAFVCPYFHLHDTGLVVTQPTGL
jgi:hypothetical protein